MLNQFPFLPTLHATTQTIMRAACSIMAIHVQRTAIPADMQPNDGINTGMCWVRGTPPPPMRVMDDVVDEDGNPAVENRITYYERQALWLMVNDAFLREFTLMTIDCDDDYVAEELEMYCYPASLCFCQLFLCRQPVQQGSS